MELPFYEIINKACGYLLLTQDGRLPIDPFDTIYRRGWGLQKYSDIAFGHNLDIDQLSRVLGSTDAAVVLGQDGYIIAYNDTKPITQIKYSLAHEIGHIALGHPQTYSTILNFDNNTLVLRNNTAAEDEANVFATNFLSPAPLFEYFKLNDPETVELMFDISPESAGYRAKFACWDASQVKDNLSQRIIKLYSRAVSVRLLYL